MHTPQLPPAPEGLEGKWLEKWGIFWESDIAGLVDISTDMEAIERLFNMYEEKDRLHAVADKTPLVPGSKEQPVLNPLYKRVESLEKEIRLLEDRIGKSLKARLQLGGSFADTMKSLNELNEATRKAAKKEKDPRLKAI